MSPKNPIYLNTPSVGLMSKNISQQVFTFNQKLAEDAAGTAEKFQMEEIPQLRKLLSLYLDAAENEIALIPNSSFGLSTLIPSLKAKSRVLLFSSDYPSLNDPFKINDFEVFYLENPYEFEIPLEVIKAQLIKHEIEILAISHVQFLSGYKIDIITLGEICKSLNVKLIVDATQSLGSEIFSFKKSNIDVLILSNYKWMNAGFGSGLMYIKEEFLQNHLPKLGGFNSYRKNEKGVLAYAPSIHSYEPGHFNLAGLLALKLELIHKMDLNPINIQKENLEKVNYFKSNLNNSNIELIGRDYKSENQSSILFFKSNELLRNHLLSHQILVNTRWENIRFGFHYYNSYAEIDYLLEVVNRF